MVLADGLRLGQPHECGHAPAVAEFFTLDDLASSQSPLDRLSPPAMLAVIGDPIAHSRSPQMHNPALAVRGIAGQYIRAQVPQGRVAEAFRLFASRGFAGANVTIPHKLEALAAVDEVDPLARRLGAVNTVVFHEGRMHGSNSDGPGFLRSVREAFGLEARDLRVMILGAGGGAGRAVAVQCALEKCRRLVLVNRTLEKTAKLAAELEAVRGELPVTDRITAVPWEDEAVRAELPGVDLVVNGTSLGMKAGDAPLLPKNALGARHLVFDMVYRPGGQLTALGKDARRAGCRYADGAVLLLHQGAISFERWFGPPAPLAEMRAGLERALRS